MIIIGRCPESRSSRFDEKQNLHLATVKQHYSQSSDASKLVNESLPESDSFNTVLI